MTSEIKNKVDSLLSNGVMDKESIFDMLYNSGLVVHNEDAISDYVSNFIMGY